MPADYFKDRYPSVHYQNACGLFMSPYEVALKQKQGQLVRWNQWHAWDFTRDTSDWRHPKTVPRPKAYDHVNPPRPNIRQQRLEREKREASALV